MPSTTACPTLPLGRPGEAVIFRHTRVYAYMPRDFKAYEADPFTGVQDAVAHAHEGACDLMVFHPGYIDAYLLDHSTMTTPRVRGGATALPARGPCLAGTAGHSSCHLQRSDLKQENIKMTDNKK